VVLFFKLGVEQRVREVGLLRAIGLSPSAIRRLFATEGLILAVAGSLLGVAGAVAYASLLMTALTTRWFDAVGTTALDLHVSPASLAIGAVSGVAAAIACIWWTLRSLRHISERSLLAGEISSATDARAPSKVTVMAAVTAAAIGIAAVSLAVARQIPQSAGFFGGGAALLVSLLTSAGAALRRPAHRHISGHGWLPVTHLALRQATHRPGRSVLSMSVIACATFILVTVDAFRRDGPIAADRSGGTGGYQLMVQTLLPLVHDPNSEAGRDALNLLALDRSTALEPFRVRPGDDTSCLNLYQPTNPRIVAPRDSFLAEGRFSFQSSAARSDDERRDPWMLLRRVEADGAIPVIADANSMAYVLHRGVGDDFVITSSGSPVTLRFVASLRDSIFQREILMSESNFRRLFPDQPGFQLLLAETKADAADVSRELEQGLSDAGADAVDTGEYLASFHRVENTYLSTFQTLGGLGLLLGTVGLATVLLRNVLERRRELALLAAVGYRRSHFLLMAISENLLIVCTGLGAGAICAAIAIAPAAAERGARLPLSSGAVLLLFSVFAVAMLSSLVAMAAATKSPVLDALRSE
jgi:putative ABC transport system permease protein